MLKKIVLMILILTIVITTVSCSSDESHAVSDTTASVLSAENMSFNFEYNCYKLQIPVISEDVTPTDARAARITQGTACFFVSDSKFAKSINFDANGTMVPALAVFDPVTGEYEIINFYRQNPDTQTWEYDTGITRMNHFGAGEDGSFWGIDITSRSEIVMGGDAEHIQEYDDALVRNGNVLISGFLEFWYEYSNGKEIQRERLYSGETTYNGVSMLALYNYLQSGITIEKVTLYTFTFYKWNENGFLEYTLQLDEIAPEANLETIEKLQCCIDTNGNTYFFYSYSGVLTAVSDDGTILYTVDVPEEWYKSVRNGTVSVNGVNGMPKLTTDTDGNAVFGVFTETNDKGTKRYPAFFRIDDQTQSVLVEETVLADTGFEAFCGVGFDVYHYDTDGFCGLTAEGESIKLFTWADFGIIRTEIRGMQILSPEEMYILLYSIKNKAWEIHLITNESADDDREVIRIAYDADGSGVKSSDLAAYIREYNVTNDAYRIEFVEYTTDKVGRTANEKLISDLLTGEAPDMILFGSSITPEKFVRQGLLIDMYTLMGGDYKKSDFLPCVRTPFESNKGELPYLVTDYIIETMIGKSSNLGGKTSWTFDEMLKMNASLGKDQTLMSLTMREGDSVPLTLLKTLLPNMLEKFIDYEKETCNFGEDFKKLLEFCKTAKVAALNGYISPSYYHDNEVLLNTSSYVLQTFLANHHVNFAGDYTYIGYPEANGSVVKARTTFGITKRSDVADGAWEFIELYLDAQTEKWEDAKERTSFDYVSALTFPATYAAFDAMVENLSLYTHFFNFGMVEGDGQRLEQGKYSMTSMKTPAADDEAGQKQLADTKLKFALAYTVTEEDVKALYALVEGITTAYMDDPAAMNIILEDANDYFIGRKSLDEVVKLIKNRVGILVSE